MGLPVLLALLTDSFLLLLVFATGKEMEALGLNTGVARLEEPPEVLRERMGERMGDIGGRIGGIRYHPAER